MINKKPTQQKLDIEIGREDLDSPDPQPTVGAVIVINKFVQKPITLYR